MKPRLIYFPFTHPTSKQCSEIRSLFNQFECLVLGYDSDTANGVVPILPPDDQALKMEKAVAEYQAWAQVHKGNERNLKSVLSDVPYFTNDTQITHIKSELLKSGQENKSADGEALLQNAFVFLKLAQTCDSEQAQIEARLRSLEENRKTLFSQLRGGNDADDDMDASTLFDPVDQKRSSAESADLGDRMTEQRIGAWCTAMTGIPDFWRKGKFPVLITTSPAVYNWFESNCNDVVNPLDIEEIKVHENVCENRKSWQQQFKDVLMQAVADGQIPRKEDLPEVEDGCNASACFKAGLFSGEKIDRLFKTAGEKITICQVGLN